MKNGKNLGVPGMSKKYISNSPGRVRKLSLPELFCSQSHLRVGYQIEVIRK